MKKLKINPTDKCLVIAPHADDESLGCGGLLLKYSDNCEVVVMTDGSKCGYKDEEEIKKIRFEELKSAMNYAKIKNFKNLMIEDKELKFNLNKLKCLNLSRYDYVFVPNQNENHIDHSCIFKKVKRMLRFAPKTKIVCYEVWTPLLEPNKYIDISDIINEKRKLISCYESQTKRRDYINKITSLNNYRGLECNKDYVEVYCLKISFFQKFLSLFCFKKNEEYFLIKFLGIKIKHNFR